MADPDQPPKLPSVEAVMPTPPLAAAETAKHIGIFGSVLCVVSCFYIASRTGMVMSSLGLIVVVPMMWAIHFTILRIARALKLGKPGLLTLIVLAWLVPALFLFSTGYTRGTPRHIFERLVMRPMPESVRDFQWGGGVGMDGAFTILFRATPTDMQAITAERGMVPYRDWALKKGESPSAVEEYCTEDESNRRISSWCKAAKLPVLWLDHPQIYLLPRTSNYRWEGLAIVDESETKAYVLVQ